MTKTYYCRNTDVNGAPSNGNKWYDLNPTAGSSATVSDAAGSQSRSLTWDTSTTEPSGLSTDWPTGAWTWYFRVTTANANVRLTAIMLRRYNNAGTTPRSSCDQTFSINQTLSSVTTYSGSITWTNINADAARAANDKFEIWFVCDKIGGSGNQTYVFGVNGTSDTRIDTALDAAGLTRVTHSDTLLYNVRKQVTKQNTLKYNLIGRITKQNTLKYHLRLQVKQQNTLKYHLLQQITKQNTLKYHLLKQITKQNTLLYNIISGALSRVTRSNTIKYNLLLFVRSLRTFDNFESGTYSFTEGGYSPDNKWKNSFLSGGTSGVRYSSSEGSNVMWMVPQAATNTGQTYSVLNQSTEKWENIDFTVRMKTVSQTRQNDPPYNWERAWIFFRTIDNDHGYYFVMKDSGCELGREDLGIEQIFLATPSNTYPLGYWNTVRISCISDKANGAIKIKVWVDGTLIIDISDDADLIPANPPSQYMFAEGAIGLYVEDSEAEFDNVIITGPTLKYNVRQQVTHQNTLKYNLLKQITKQNTLLYNVISGALSRVTNSNTLKYNLRQQITKQNTLKYNVLKQVLKSNTLKYNVLQQITKSNTLVYNLLQRVVHQNILKYNLKLQVLHSNTIKYSLLKQVTSQNTLKYNVWKLVTKSNILVYNVLVLARIYTATSASTHVGSLSTFNLDYEVEP